MWWLLWWKLSISAFREMGKVGLELWLSYWEPLILVSTEMKRTIFYSWAFLNINVMLSFTYHAFFFFLCLFLAKKHFHSSAVFNGTENGDGRAWLLLGWSLHQAPWSVSFHGLLRTGIGQCSRTVHMEAEREGHSRGVQDPHSTNCWQY